MIKLYFLTILYIILTTYANCDKYRIITQVNYNDNVRVVIYGSLRTRLKIALANESGPLVKATFNFGLFFL